MTARTPVRPGYAPASVPAKPVCEAGRVTIHIPDFGQDPRSLGDPVGELATYREYLDHFRLTLEMKCAGLTTEQLARRSVPPSTLSLLGLVRHMAKVEHSWFERVLKGQLHLERLYRPEDDHDFDFNGAAADDAVVEDAFTQWKAQIASADAWLDSVRRGRARPGRGRPGRRDVERPRHPRAHGRGVRAALRPRRPAARDHRRPDRPVAAPVRRVSRRSRAAWAPGSRPCRCRPGGRTGGTTAAAAGGYAALHDVDQARQRREPQQHRRDAQGSGAKIGSRHATRIITRYLAAIALSAMRWTIASRRL